MSDYIEREDAIEAIGNFLSRENDYFVDMAKGTIKLIPSADVAPIRHGHWIKISPAGIYECSECQKNVMTSDIEAYKYCHGCGARMDGENDE